MIEIIVGAAILILVTMIIRRLTKGKISMRLRYALWIMAALRLILPVSIGSSPFSVMNLQKAVESYMAENMQDMHGELADEAIYGQNEKDAGYDSGISGAEQSGQNQGIRKTARNKSGWLFYAVIGIWIAGIVAVGGYMAVAQIRFISYLYRTRKEVSLYDFPDIWAKRLTARKMRIYTVQGLPSPCMAGRSIYVNPQLYEEKDRMQHILAHEYAHAVQGDALWALVRCILCAVYWFHPLVWLAAYEAKQDSELACDERAIALLGETQRFPYGRTLLDLLSDGHNARSRASVVLTMDGSAKKVRERVAVIAGKTKKSRCAAAIVVLSAVLACGCAFTGAQQPNADIKPEAEGLKQQEDAAKRAEEAKIEQLEQELAAIRKYQDELEAEAQEIQAIRAEEQEKQEKQEQIEEAVMHAVEAKIEQLELEEAAIREHIEEISQLEQKIKEEWRQATEE